MNHREFINWKKQFVAEAKKTKTPISGQFELTPRCNLDCKMCYIHNQDSNKLKDLELTTEQWKHIFNQACDMGMLFATLTGGECLLRNDFKELYLHLINRGVMVSIISNGLLLDDDMISFFKSYPPVTIYVSVYGSCDTAYKNVTGHACFGRVLDALKRLKNSGLYFRVNVTPSSYIADDYINILKFLKDNGCTTNYAEFLISKKRYDTDATDHYLSVEQIEKLTIERYSLRGSIPIPVKCLPEVGGCAEEVELGLTCSAGNNLAFVNWEGKMYPCVTLFPYGGFSLLEMSYAEAWAKTVDATQKIINPVECNGCAYIKACPKCIATRSPDLNSGHCDPQVCEYTKRLVAAGVKKLDKPQEDDEEIEH